MRKIPIILALFYSISFASSDSVLVITKHDTVFIDRIIIDNPEAVKRMTEPFKTEVSKTKKICGWTMIVAGVSAGAFSIFNLSEGTVAYRQQTGDEWDDVQAYRNRKFFRKTGFYEINICLSVGLIAAGISTIVK